MDKEKGAEKKEDKEEEAKTEEKNDDDEKEVISVREDENEEGVPPDNSEVKAEKTIKPRKSKKKLAAFLLIFLSIVTAGALSGGGVYLWQKNKSKPQPAEEPKAEEKDEETAPAEEENVVYVNSLVGLNLRKSPSLTAEVITILKYGTKLTPYNEDGSFYFGKDASGNEGYFAKEFTSKTDPLSEWITYNGKNYTVKHPKDWQKKSCDDSSSIGFGPDEASLQLCNSEKGALISIYASEETKSSYISSAKTSLDTFSETNIKVSGADAVRIEGTTKEAEVGPQKGSVSISVVLDAGSGILVLSYMQSPTGTDYSDIFDLMAENFSLAG